MGLSIALYAVPVASSHRRGFKYAAHTPAAVCGWRSEQNLAAAVPRSVSVRVCCLWVCVCLLCCFVFKALVFVVVLLCTNNKITKKCRSDHRFRHVSVISVFVSFLDALGAQSGRVPSTSRVPKAPPGEPQSILGDSFLVNCGAFFA